MVAKDRQREITEYLSNKSERNKMRKQTSVFSALDTLLFWREKLCVSCTMPGDFHVFTLTEIFKILLGLLPT